MELLAGEEDYVVTTVCLILFFLKYYFLMMRMNRKNVILNLHLTFQKFIGIVDYQQNMKD